MSVAVVEPMEFDPVRGRRLLLAVVALVVLAVAGRSAFVWWNNRAPYGADALQSQISVTLGSPSSSQAALDRLTGGHDLTAVWPGDSGPAYDVVGRLTLARPAGSPATGNFAFFLTDDRAGGTPAALLTGWVDGRPSGGGWDSSYEAIPARYPHLGGLRMVAAEPGSFSAPGDGLTVPAAVRRPVVFSAMVPTDGQSTSQVARHLSGVLAFYSPSGHLYWAKTVPVS